MAGKVQVFVWANGQTLYGASIAPAGRGTKALIRAIWSMIRTWPPTADGLPPKVVISTLFWAEDAATLDAAMSDTDAAVKKLVQEDQLSRREKIAEKVMKSKVAAGLIEEYKRNAGILIAVQGRQKNIELGIVEMVQKALKDAELNSESVWFDGDMVRVSAQLSDEGRPTGPRQKVEYTYHTAHVGTTYTHAFTRKEIDDGPIMITCYRGETEWLARIEQKNPKGNPFKQTLGGKTPYAACKAAVRWLLVKRLGQEQGDAAQVSYNWNKLLKIPTVGEEQDEE